MARPLRLQFSGALYHVTSRGNEKRSLFLEDHDFKRRVDWLARTIETYGWRLHAFVLMTNHEHLFVSTPEPNLSTGMQYLNGSYAGYFNARHERVGHLFEGRFKAILIETEGHYSEISRYIHLNPVRAAMASRPEAWPWSSYSGYHRRSQALPWVTYSRVLSEFGRDEAAARRAYHQFIAAGIEHPAESPLRAAVYDLALGSEEFVERLRRSLKGGRADPALPQQRQISYRTPLPIILRAVAECMKADRADWAKGQRSDQMARAVAAHVARRHGYSATEAAKALGYAGPSGVHMALRRLTAAHGRFDSVLNAIESRLSDRR